MRLKLIAVNDASPDDTIDILRSYTDPRLKIINRRENRGHIFTVNEGMQAARGKYMVRIDPDDRHRTHFLETLVPVLEADSLDWTGLCQCRDHGWCRSDQRRACRHRAWGA